MAVDFPVTFEVLFVAALAPVLGVIAFWFLQMVLIEFQKRLLSRLKYHHEAFCRFTNYIGILFQAISQALGYTVTRSGVSSFQVTVNYEKVEPRKEKEGVFDWVARSFLLFGPFFIPAGLVLIISYFVIGRGFVYPTPVSYSFVESLAGFWMSLSSFATMLGGFLINMDLFNPLHIGYVFVLLFLGLGIRPSYIGQERKEKIDILHDLIRIKDHLIEKPLYLLLIILFLYMFYVLSLFLNPQVYIGLFVIFGWMSLTAIIAILLTIPLLLLIWATDAIQPRWNIVPYFSVPVSYIVTRVCFIFYPVNAVERVSLLAMVLLTVLVTIALIKYKRTNRFKTATKMKHVRVADGKKRTSKK